jgi:hypothetical protein
LVVGVVGDPVVDDQARTRYRVGRAWHFPFSRQRDAREQAHIVRALDQIAPAIQRLAVVLLGDRVAVAARDVVQHGAFVGAQLRRRAIRAEGDRRAGQLPVDDQELVVVQLQAAQEAAGRGRIGNRLAGGWIQQQRLQTGAQNHRVVGNGLVAGEDVLHHRVVLAVAFDGFGTDARAPGAERRRHAEGVGWGICDHQARVAGGRVDIVAEPAFHVVIVAHLGRGADEIADVEAEGAVDGIQAGGGRLSALRRRDVRRAGCGAGQRCRARRGAQDGRVGGEGTAVEVADDVGYAETRVAARRNQWQWLDPRLRARGRWRC